MKYALPATPFEGHEANQVPSAPSLFAEKVHTDKKTYVLYHRHPGWNSVYACQVLHPSMAYPRSLQGAQWELRRLGMCRCLVPLGCWKARKLAHDSTFAIHDSEAGFRASATPALCPILSIDCYIPPLACQTGAYFRRSLRALRTAFCRATRSRFGGVGQPDLSRFCMHQSRGVWQDRDCAAIKCETVRQRHSRFPCLLLG